MCNRIEEWSTIHNEHLIKESETAWKFTVLPNMFTFPRFNIDASTMENLRLQGFEQILLQQGGALEGCVTV